MEKLVFAVYLTISSLAFADPVIIGSNEMNKNSLEKISPTFENSKFIPIYYSNQSSTYNSNGSSSESFEVGNETITYNSDGSSSSTFSMPRR